MEYCQMDLFIASSEDKTVEKKSELNSRQWEMYRLIKYNSLVNHRKTTQREIYEKVRGYEWNDDEKCHDHCVAIWGDVTSNNLSMEHEHLIISKGFTYWLGSAEETNQFLQDLWKALSPRLSRYWQYVKKVSQDGQFKLLDKNNNPVDFNASNRFFNAFNDYNISMGE